VRLKAILKSRRNVKMQIRNFYSDMVPSVRNPLDSIVLSPHTLHHDYAVDESVGDYQSLLPSPCCCQYHEQGADCVSNGLSSWIKDKYLQIKRKCE
jgi:hypothetical protein